MVWKWVLAALLVAVGVAVLIWLAPGAQPTPRPAPAPPPVPLTVAETLGLAYTGPFLDEPPSNYFSKANPEARPALLKILADPAQQRFHHNIWHILGYIGEDADVALIEEHIGRFSGVLTNEQYDALSAMYECLGLMSRRGIAAAGRLVDRMQEPEYWRAQRFTRFQASMPRDIPPEYEEIMRLMVGYSLSQAPDLEKRCQRILSRIEDPELKAVMSRALVPRHLREHADNILRNENEPVDAASRAGLAELFNGDLEHPGPSPVAFR